MNGQNFKNTKSSNQYLHERRKQNQNMSTIIRKMSNQTHHGLQITAAEAMN